MSNVIPFQRSKVAVPFRRLFPIQNLTSPYFHYEPQFRLTPACRVGVAVDVGQYVPPERLKTGNRHVGAFLGVAFRRPFVQAFKVILDIAHYLHGKLRRVADVGCRVGEQGGGESLQHGKSAAHLDFKIVHLKSFQGNKDPEEKA